MATRDIIVMGASAGGLEALRKVIASLPGDLPAAVFVVLHVPAEPPEVLASLLQRTSSIPVTTAEDHEPIVNGHVHVAAANRHLILEPGRVRVVHGPRENLHRPAIDPLFRSAAWAYGPRVVGVILTGTLDDGVAGLWAIRTCGGVTIAQDPAEAAFPEMPARALASVGIDHCVRLAEVGPLIVTLSSTTAPRAAGEAPAGVGLETAFALGNGSMASMDKLGVPSTFTCPTCRGTLWEIREGALLRYRCHTGHAFTADTLASSQADDVDNALTTSLRAIEEKAELMRRLAAQLAGGTSQLRQHYESKARELDGQAATLRHLLPRLAP